MMKTLGILAFTFSLLTLTGCGETNTDTDYPSGVAPIDESARETQAPSPGEATPDDTPDTNANNNTQTVEGLVYTVPAGWTVGGPRQMRVLTLEAGDGVEVAVAKWPNGVGGMESNLTRWMGQAGYNPADAATLQAVRDSFETLNVGGAEATWMPLLDGTGPSPMIALWVPRQGETWTFKTTGEADALRAKQDELRAWAESLSFE